MRIVRALVKHAFDRTHRQRVRSHDLPGSIAACEDLKRHYRTEQHRDNEHFHETNRNRTGEECPACSQTAPGSRRKRCRSAEADAARGRVAGGVNYRTALAKGACWFYAKSPMSLRFSLHRHPPRFEQMAHHALLASMPWRVRRRVTAASSMSEGLLVSAARSRSPRRPLGVRMRREPSGSSLCVAR